MLVLEDKKKRIGRAFIDLKQILRNYGCMISMPKNTDPTKTYNWRYMKNFIDKFDTLGLDDSSMPDILEAIVIEAKKKKLLKCGISFLNKIDLLKASYRKLENDVNDEIQIMNNIRCSHDFLLQQLSSEENGDYDSIEQLLLAKKNLRGYANVTRWFDSGQISKGYLAVSKTCKRVIRKLDIQQLELFPTARQFLVIKIMLQSREQMWTNLQTILGDDLHEE